MTWFLAFYSVRLVFCVSCLPQLHELPAVN